MKQAIKLRESELRRMIAESVRRVLKENYGKPFPINPSDLARQLYNTGCDFYMFVHRLEKTYEMIKDEKNNSFNIGEIQNYTAFHVTIEGQLTPQELDALERISYKYQKNIEYDGGDAFYIYDKDALNNFIKDLKSLGLGKTAYIYKGEEPDYEWEQIAKITI